MEIHLKSLKQDCQAVIIRLIGGWGFGNSESVGATITTIRETVFEDTAGLMRLILVGLK